MALRDLFVSNDGKPKLYRQAWSETSDPLVAEAFLGISDQVREIAEQFEEMNEPEDEV